MAVLADHEEWADLAARYSFTYGMRLQERLATQGIDIQDWWRMGGQLIQALPEKARDIILQVALETGVPAKRILGGQQLAQFVAARHEAVRRLAAMPWRGGWKGSERPSPQQIAQWMNMERSTVARIVKRTDACGG